MNAIVDVTALPVAERLRLMESLWDSLCAAQCVDEAVPAWHADVLAERLSRLDSGKEPIRPWADAKDVIRQQVRAK